ncbi:MAG: RAD55 family ATPase [Candidatus Hodarchaeota archaeon]
MPNQESFVTFGLPGIDTLLGGGLRRGTTCLLEELHGESSGMSGLAGIHFLLTGVQQGEGAILLLSEHTVTEFQQLPGTQQLLSIAKPNQFVFMDALSSMTYGEPASQPTDDDEGIIRCSNVRYDAKFYEEWRNTVSMFENPLMYIDSLSVLLHAMESDKAAWRFWLSLLPLIRHRHLTIVGSFYPHMHSPAFVESIERICDTIIQFTSEPTANGVAQRIIQVVKNRGFNFDERKHPYDIRDFDFGES